MGQTQTRKTTKPLSSQPVVLDRWVKCVSSGGNIRSVGITATHLVQDMAETHEVKGIGAQGLGEAVMGALMLASFCKEGERINLNIRGSSHFKQALIDAYPDGHVRGYIVEQAVKKKKAAPKKKATKKGRKPVAKGPKKLPKGIIEINLDGDDQPVGPWGQGLLSVLRTKGKENQQPYIGTVPLLTGHLAKDLTFYWAQSEQIPSAVGLAVETDKKGKVVLAGGFLVQALPGATDEEIHAIELQLKHLPSMASELAKNSNPLSLVSRLMQDEPFVVVEEKDIAFRCPCSRERVERSLILTGVAELKAILKEDKKARVQCDFCRELYVFGKAELQALIERLSG